MARTVTSMSYNRHKTVTETSGPLVSWFMTSRNAPYRAVRAALLCCVGAVVFALTAFAADPQRKPFDVPAGPAPAALKQFISQSGVQLLYVPGEVKDVQTKSVKGSFTPAEAIEVLLVDTGLVSHIADTGAISVSRAIDPNVQRAIVQTEKSDRPSKTNANHEKEKSGDVLALDTFTVTGTRIKGAKPTSPLVMITQEEMRLSGQNNLGEVIRALPQNFSGGQNPEVASGADTGANIANQNITGSSGLNLRGLGPDATLTLLNGNRLPYDGVRQATDVSAIPVAAIERMEILLDGASAIYGSDAVGGVANIVLKRNVEGIEVSARFGAATDGGYEQQQYTFVGGTSWGKGGFLMTGNYSNTKAVKAKQRDTLSYMTGQNATIYPAFTQKGGLVSFHQKLGVVAEFRLDTFYTKRTQESLTQASASSFGIVDTDSLIWGVSPSLDVALPGDWSARLHAAFGRNEMERTFSGISVATLLQTSRSLTEFFNGMQSTGIELEGPLWALPAGNARASVGGGYRNNSLDRRSVNLVTAAISSVLTADESSRYIYAEVDLPLVSEGQNMPLARRLSLNAALRHENYNSFGASTTPKIGAIWGLAPSVDIKASWGESFKVPTLLQRYDASSLILYPGSSFGQAAGSQVLVFPGPNPDLTPEKAEIITAGFVARPKFLPGLRFEFGYFDIDYKDRVASPIDNLFATLSNPIYAQFVALNPTIAEQNVAFAATNQPFGTFLPGLNLAGAPYNAANVIAIIDARTINVSSHRASGVDLNMRYATGLLGGNLSLSGNGSWITKGVRKLTSLAPELPAAGVNFWPAKFKGRFGAGWSRDGFNLNANVNHIAGIVDRAVTPNVKRSSMTTLDLVVDFQLKLNVVGDVGFNLAVTNLFNKAPPFLHPVNNFRVNYDSTNYSALGRVVSATVTKRF